MKPKLRPGGADTSEDCQPLGVKKKSSVGGEPPVNDGEWVYWFFAWFCFKYCDVFNRMGLRILVLFFGAGLLS